MPASPSAMPLSRRALLAGGTALAAEVGATLSSLGCAREPAAVGRYGKLLPDPAGLLELPAGFSYRVLARTGEPLAGGGRRRGLPDGMAAFTLDSSRLALLVNHELEEDGGVSRLVLDAHSLEVLSQNDVLLGTRRNCSGGAHPLGWLSCEEHESGGVWLCPIDSERPLAGAERRRLDALGTFRHEAACTDPATGLVYLTEDDGESHLYRMVPSDRARAPLAGQLQALRHPTRAALNTGLMKVGETLPVTWVDVEPTRARASAQARGAAVFHRGEGMAWAGGAAFFSATTTNQIFRFTPGAKGDLLTLLALCPESPDNLTLTPDGEVLIAEDQAGHCRLRLVERGGRVSDLARNVHARGQELAGVCFSPGGETLFVNLQHSGLTLAIRGPFAR